MHPRAAVNSANSLRQKDHFWTDERVALLRREWAAGAFVGDIAQALGTTREAVIGKAHRLKLTRRHGWSRFGSARRDVLIRVARETAGART